MICDISYDDNGHGYDNDHHHHGYNVDDDDVYDGFEDESWLWASNAGLCK